MTRATIPGIGYGARMSGERVAADAVAAGDALIVGGRAFRVLSVTTRPTVWGGDARTATVRVQGVTGDCIGYLGPASGLVTVERGA